MWIHPAAVSEDQVRYAEALGRAVVLAQNFEQNCKFVFGTWDLGRAHSDGRLPIEEWRVYAKKLQDRSLGAVLKAQHSGGSFSAEQIARLEAARAARNYIAHEAGEPAQYVAPASGKLGGTKKLRELLSGTLGREIIERERAEMLASHLDDAVPRFEEAVRALAEADGMVAGWCYLIEEKDEQLPSLALTYPRTVASWVLEPLVSAGLVSGG